MKVVQLEIIPPAPQTRDASCPWPRWPTLLKDDYGQQEAEAVWGQRPARVLREHRVVRGHGRACEGTEHREGRVGGKGRQALPTPIPCTEKSYPADLVLIAMGFTGANDYALQGPRRKEGAGGRRVRLRGHAHGAEPRGESDGGRAGCGGEDRRIFESKQRLMRRFSTGGHG